MSGSGTSANGDGVPFTVRRTPGPALAGLVCEIIGYDENGHALRGAVETASLVAPLIISFGDAFSIALGRAPSSNDRWASFAAGLYAGPVLMDSTGAAACVQVNFTPQGAHRFFGLPMSELADRMVTLDELGDRDILRLREQLGSADDWNRRLDIAEAFVAARLRRAPRVDAAIEHTYRRMLAAHGDIRMSRLARDLGWSRKHLAARFRDEFGLAPKAIARIIRFQSVLAQARRAGSGGWAGVAATCGYSDQAHLTREFVELAGTTPSRWLAQAR